MASRLTELIRRIPPCTLFFIGLCLIIFLVQFIFGGLSECAISAYLVLYKYQIYRIFTSTFTHNGILHIVFNMMSFYSINPSLERKYGSVFMLYCMILFTVINGLFYVLIYYLLSLISYDFIYAAAVGFSGVIFSLLTITSFITQQETLSVFGLFSVPRKWYALTYLVLMSLLMPSASFVGHLCGVISGFLFVSGYLNWCIPMHCIVGIEKSFVGDWMKKSEAFVYIPEIHETIGSALSFRNMLGLAFDGMKSLLCVTWSALQSIFKFCFDSVFPPSVDTHDAPLPASGQNSDIESGPSKEEIRRQRLAALSTVN